MDNDISLLRRCIEDRSPILLLGAGFSLGAKGRNGQKLMLGGALAQRLYEEIIIPNKDLLTEESSKYTQSLNSSILSQSSKDFLEMRIA